MLTYVTVLRVHAALVRSGEVRRHCDPRAVRDALLAARVVERRIRGAREGAGDLSGRSDPHADAAAAVLVAFAAGWRAFGAGYDAALVIDALVRTQVETGGLVLDLSLDELGLMIRGAMVAAASGLPIDSAGIARELSAALRAPRGLHEPPPQHPYRPTR